jgi:hypothetical protein
MGLAALLLDELPSLLELVAALVIIGGVLLGTPRVVGSPQLVTSLRWKRQTAAAKNTSA